MCQLSPEKTSPRRSPRIVPRLEQPPPTSLKPSLSTGMVIARRIFRRQDAAILTAGLLSSLIGPSGSLLPSMDTPPPWRRLAWVTCGMRLPSPAFMIPGEGDISGQNPSDARNKRPSVSVATLPPFKAARMTGMRNQGALRALSSSGAPRGEEGPVGPNESTIYVKAEEAEKDLEPLELPDGLAGWIDRLPADLLDAIDIIEGEGGGACWLVGGCVRDCLSGLVPWEVDMASTLDPQRLLELFPRAIDTGSQYGTVTIRQGGVSVECTTLRMDSDYSDGRRPDRVDFGTSLLEDLARRDFTINAMAVNVKKRRLFDPFGGATDVKTATLRAVGSAEGRLREDGLRTMRGYRFMDGKTGVRVADPELSEALKLTPQLLTPISRERIWAELRRILSGPRAPLVLERMAEDGVLETLLDHTVTKGCRGLAAVSKLPHEHLPLWWGQQESLLNVGEEPAVVDNGRDDPFQVPRAPMQKQIYTHVAVIDLEATCDDRRGFSPQEIIELPCVLIDVEKGTKVGQFRTFVRPAVNPSLTDFCKSLTGISQADVDAAPSFPEALAMLTDWLTSQGVIGEGSEKASLLVAADGDWDLRSMMPKQCVLSDVEIPSCMHTWADIRVLFTDHVANSAVAPGLIKMCQALRLQFHGKAHSGLDDSLNIARVVLALLQDHNAVLRETSMIKGYTNNTNGDKANDAFPISPQASLEERTFRSVCGRLSLILAVVPPERADANLKNLKLSREEIKACLAHMKIMGNLPSSDNAGQLRRYRAVLGPAQMELQLRLEAAWAASEPDDARRAAAVSRVEKVAAAMASLPPLSSPGGSEPLVNGKWLMEVGRVKPGPLMGKIKDYLHYLQVDRDLSTLELVEEVFREEMTLLDSMDKKLYEVHVNALPRLRWPPL